jgi:hypothetical protein
VSSPRPSGGVPPADFEESGWTARGRPDTNVTRHRRFSRHRPTVARTEIRIAPQCAGRTGRRRSYAAEPANAHRTILFPPNITIDLAQRTGANVGQPYQLANGMSFRCTATSPIRLLAPEYATVPNACHAVGHPARQSDPGARPSTATGQRQGHHPRRRERLQDRINGVHEVIIDLIGQGDLYMYDPGTLTVAQSVWDLIAGRMRPPPRSTPPPPSRSTNSPTPADRLKRTVQPVRSNSMNRCGLSGLRASHGTADMRSNPRLATSPGRPRARRTRSSA